MSMMSAPQPYYAAIDLWSSLLTLGRVDASITLLSLNRSLRHYDIGGSHNACAKIQNNSVIVL